MPRKLRVYGWSAFHIRDMDKKHNQMWRCVVAATSQIDVCRITGKASPRDFWQLSETWNEEAVAMATAKPGVVFFRLNEYTTQPWHELDDVKRL